MIDLKTEAGVMSENVSAKPIYLCAGMPSGGTTLVSWCFLQRPDMDGVLDMPGNLILQVPEVNTPQIWYKFAISFFRWPEVAAVMEQWGWKEIKPLLVARDIRTSLASLRTKPYGQDSVRAPLRVRALRFLEDWRLFHKHNWPVLRYESLIEQPEATLRSACHAMSLPWHEAMMSFPKPRESIAYHEHGNRSFFEALSRDGLETSLQRYRQQSSQRQFSGLSPVDIAWLDETFSEYNQVHGYPMHGNAFIDPKAMPLVPKDDVYSSPNERMSALYNLRRLQKHPVFGRLIPAWRRFINSDFDIFPKS